MKPMRKTFLLTLLFTLCGLTWAQAPVATAEEAITGLLNRIGGNGAANLFEIVIDADLAENGKDVFVITSQNGKPCIKGNTQLSVATGINWYLNHYAHVNLTWNNLTTDLSKVTLPVPEGEEKHVCNAAYRYDFNTCTFSYSMAFWTWERWQQEIDWMALHGINAPLNLVGLDVVTRKFLRELGVNENDINAYIAGPGFIAWFAMNNLEGWGGTIESQNTGVYMKGNPDWWYTRQEKLCRDMLQRMRELGMQPVIPGFSGQVPNCIVNYSIDGFSSGDVVNNGTWAGGYTRPDILKPNTESYRTFAAVYYKHLHEVMGVSELYSIDPFHEGSLPSGVSNETCYPNIMKELDNYYNGVSQADKTKNNVDEQPKWIIQYWQGVPQSGAFSAMSSYGDRFIGLDLFADNIYANNAAKWRTDYYKGRPYIYCMLHNFGGRSGLHGRLETTMDGYFQALAKGNNCQGIGATPEGTETNPILYDMLFELPWMDPATRPTADKWLAQYAHARYGVQNSTALSALQDLKESVWNCKVNQQGTSEAVILARPNWTVGSVSSWSTAAIYWDTQDVLQAADKLYSIKEAVTTNGGQDGIANYNYDFIDVVRQAMVDYAAELLPLINAARGNNAEYTRLYQLYLQLMLDLDEMLSYDENFKLERWTSLARNIADEVEGTTENDRNWLEWNARTQITVWSKGNTDLHDYSNRCWAGLIKDFHYRRWEKFFTTNGGSFDGGWFNGFEYPWTVDFNDTYNLAGDYSKVVIPTDMTATEKAAQTFGNYFGRVKGATKNYIFPMGITRKATKSDVIPEVYRGKTVDLPLVIGKNVAIASVWVDLNNDGAKGNGETLTATNNQIAIPADAKIGKTTAQVVYSDGTDITFNLALVEDIDAERTVTAVAGENGAVAIEGTNELSITNTEAVKITATANTGYNFEKWTDANGNVVSNDNPYIYYGKEAATFTANFIEDKWGVVACSGAFSGDIASYAQFIHNLTLAYYDREPETILEETTAPTQIFNTIPTIINVPRGASFDVAYDNGGGDGLKYCYFRAFIDLNQDGDFDDEGELLKEVGSNGAQNTAVCSNKISVLLPYDMPLGITHMRLRFDGAWDNSGKPSSRGAKDASIRPVYEIIINVTEKSDKAATINVKTNNAEWGTVEVWTDETPDGSTGSTWNVSANIPMYLRATKTSDDVDFLGWYDRYGRLVSTDLEYSMYAREDATYTARFLKGKELRALGELIDLTEALIEEVAISVNPIGKATEITLQTTEGQSYFIWCSNPHVGGNDGAGGVAALLDENPSTYLHSNWSSLSSTHDYLQIDNIVNPEGLYDLYNFKIVGQQRGDGQNDRPKNVEIYGSNDKTNWTPITVVTGLPNTAGATWASNVISTRVKYSSLKFVVKTHDNENNVGRPYFHMAKFDLFKLTSTVEVAPEYRSLSGITNEEVAELYDCMINALYVYNNGGTDAEIKTILEALQTSYANLNAKKDVNGVYRIKIDDKPVFIAYNTFQNQSRDGIGYKLIVPSEEAKATAVGDELFSIVPTGSGYSIAAQGKYLQQPNHSTWTHLMFSDNKDDAGVYVFEPAGELVKIRHIEDGKPYVNSYGKVFGNDAANAASGISTFKIEKVNTFPLSMASAGVAALCLPFHVVMPEGVCAYDLVASDVEMDDAGKCIGTLQPIAYSGETLKAGTPVVVMADVGSYELTITMQDDGANGSLIGSLLHGNFVEEELVAGNFCLAEVEKSFSRIGEDVMVKPNQCWLELPEDLDDVQSIVLRVGGEATAIDNTPLVRQDGLSQQGIYNVVGQRLTAPQKGYNIINGKKVLVK